MDCIQSAFTALLCGGRSVTIYQYKAFLSYSHRDKKWADWLHRRLETYKFPKKLSSTPKTLKPVFRDREELPASSDLSRHVQEALQQSECLIVLCSQSAAKSDWVNREINLFKTLRPGAEIFPVIISGEPNAARLGLDPNLECFPPALRFATSGGKAPVIAEIEPLAADLRKDKDGKQLGLVKLISGIVDIRPDDLIQRDFRRARRRVTAITALSVSIVSILTLLTISTVIARNAAERNELIAQQQRELAETRRDEAEGLIEFMLGDLRQELEPVGRLSILTNVADRALKYYEDTDDMSACKSASGAARAKYLRTRIAVSQDNFTQARAYSDDALNLLESMAADCGDVKQFVTNHSHALQWSADLDIMQQAIDSDRRKLDPAILRKYERAKANLEGFTSRETASLDMKIEVVDANILVGKYHMRVNQPDKALIQFQAAKDILAAEYSAVDPLIKSPISDGFLIRDKYADILSWISGAYEKLSKLDKSFATLQDARAIYTSLTSDALTTGQNWKVRFDVIGTDYALSRLHYKRGQKQATLDILYRLKKDIAQLMAQDPSNQKWREQQDNILSSIATLKNL